jgi:RimK family alpha-L-glutamate ligase
MNLFIITPNSSSSVTNQIHEALIQRNIKSIRVNLPSIEIDLTQSNADISTIFKRSFNGIEPDGIISRGIGIRKTKYIYFRVDVYRAMQFLDVPIINSPECMEISTDKMLTSLLLKKNNISTPDTIVCEDEKIALDAYHKLGEDIVVKPMYGSKGTGVTRVNNEGFAEYLFYNLARMDEPFYIQKYIEHNNKDIRAFVIGGQVVASMERIGTDWRTNIAKGAQGVAIKLDEEGCEMAIKSTEIVKGEVMGVDLIKTEEGYSIIEINAVPGINGIQEATNLDIAGMMADYFIKTFKK